jgi:hypothetical protein
MILKYIRYQCIPSWMSSLLLITFLLIVLNQALFLHNHLMNDGRFVSHAHPFSKDSGQHQHQPNDYYVLDQLHSLWNDGFKQLFLTIISPNDCHIPVIEDLNKCRLFIPFSPLRGPPVHF